MDKKILITGGAGFIGSHTAVSLHESGYTPIIVDNFQNSDPCALKGIEAICQRRMPFYEGDCGNRDFLSSVFAKEGNIAGVIHFAAYKAVNESNQFPLNYYRNNIGSLITLLEVMAEYKVSNLVFSSSCTVYGSPEIIPVTEDTPIRETPSTYGKTKQICEAIIEDVVSRESGIKGVLLRYFNPIGAHPSGLIGELPIGVPNNLVPFITQTACGWRKQLTVFGGDYRTADGTCIRDFIHVVDLARAHIQALRYMEKHPDCRLEKCNVGTGKGHSVLEIIQTFEHVSGECLAYTIGKRRDGDVEAVYADASKAGRLLGWHAELTIEDAVRDAWNWQQRLMNNKEIVSSGIIKPPPDQKTASPESSNRRPTTG
ncbi:MAG: UDP-glucose 4-epimerase GalE [Candidatus Omnitrophica bacterium]|nr:UDP-glucose 4-epimerase GalE [Candidatus Omnitrophota bacterium]